MLVLLAGTLLALSLFLLVWGVRGTVVRIGPTCRKCRFDLSGLQLPLATCPECGSDLASNRRAVVQVLRRRRPVAISLGSLLLLLMVVGSGWQLTGSLATSATQARLPTWALVLETRIAPTLTAPALAELSARVRKSQLSAETTDVLVARALTIQADPSATWNGAWGDFIAAAKRAGMVSNETWTTFVRQGVSITLDARPRVRAGRTIPIAVTMKGGRLGGSSLSVGPVQIRRRVAGPPGGLAGGISMSVSSLGSATTAWDHPAPSAALGAAEFPIELHVALLNESGGDESPLGNWTKTFNVKVDILPADAITLSPIRSSQLKAQMGEALRGSEVHMGVFGSSGQMEVRVHAKSSPALLAARVFVRPAGQLAAPLFDVGALFQRADTNWSHFVSQEWPAGVPVPERVDVILRPDPTTAENSVFATEYLDEEIVLEGIVVQSPSTNPAITPAK